MYTRRPPIARGQCFRLPQRCRDRAASLRSSSCSNTAAPAPVLSAPATAAAAASPSRQSHPPLHRCTDFAAYIAAECTDLSFSPAVVSPGLPSTPVDSTLTASAASPVAPRSCHSCSSHLRSGANIASLHPNRAVLNQLNRAVWLQVLPLLNARGALSREDCTGAIRYLPPTIYRPLLPWLWGSSDMAAALPQMASCLPSSTESITTSAPHQLKKSLHECTSTETMVVSAASTAPRPPVSCHRDASARSGGEAPSEKLDIAHLAVADPSTWCRIIQRLLAETLPTSASRQARLHLWHQCFFSMLQHSFWSSSPGTVSTRLHPQLLEVLQRFYEDVRRSNAASSWTTASGEAPALILRTYTPPIILRKLRGLYQHHHLYLLYTNLYMFCMEKEEELTTIAAATDGGSGGVDRHDCSCIRGNGGPSSLPLQTTALLMDVDLMVYFAAAPGRRRNGLRHPPEQWHLTLKYLVFIVPRVLRVQRCLAARGGRSAEELQQPWRRIASVVMNVGVWVENNNAEGERCAAAMRCSMAAYFSATASSCSSRADRGDKAAGTPSFYSFVSVLMETSRQSMLAKAKQLRYGPVDGLMDVYLLSVVAEVLRITAQRLDAGGGSRSIDEDDDDNSILAVVHRVFHESKQTPSSLWAALHRHPDAGAAARYGLVVLGYRLFRDGVVQLGGSPATMTTALRLWRRLCSWVNCVGHPLQLSEKAVGQLWRHRLLQDHQKEKESDATSPSKIFAALQASSALTAAAESASTTWDCGCGVSNVAPWRDAGAEAVEIEYGSAACVACVLQTLKAGSWECPECHAVAEGGSSSMYTPYCISCGATHPALAADARELCGSSSRKRSDEGMPVVVLLRTAPQLHQHDYTESGCHKESAVQESVEPKRLPCSWDTGEICDDCSFRDQAAAESVEVLCFVCNSCSSITPSTTADHDLPGTAGDGGEAASPQCSACGSGDGYFTRNYQWHCGCGAANAALHRHCTKCSKAAHRLIYQCPSCQCERHAAATGACGRCSAAPPQLTAAATANRLVRCPNCQFHLSRTAHRCSHCGSEAVGAVSAILPTEADQPWSCHHCGHAHSLRDAAGATLPPSDTAVQASAIAAAAATERCKRCRTPRIPASIFEKWRPWRCGECGTAENTAMACRSCQALPRGVPQHEVSLWLCSICNRRHASWEASCSTSGCGGQQPPLRQSPQRWCYSPWACPTCGGVSRSSHLAACEYCRSATPDDILAYCCRHESCAVRQPLLNASPSSPSSSTEGGSAQDGAAWADQQLHVRHPFAARVGEEELHVFAAAEVERPEAAELRLPVVVEAASGSSSRVAKSNSSSAAMRGGSKVVEAGAAAVTSAMGSSSSSSGSKITSPSTSKEKSGGGSSTPARKAAKSHPTIAF